MFLGGVIVILLFIVSVCANEKFFKPDVSRRGLFFWGCLFLLLMCSPKLKLNQRFNGFQFSRVLYEAEGALAFILFMCVLILCLIRVVKIRRLESGPLVKRL